MVSQQDTIIPNFKLNAVPNIQIKSLHIKNFKAYDDYHYDFTDGNECKSFVCFIGENGVGKSTALNALQLVFGKFDGCEDGRVQANLGKSVRHVEQSSDGVYGEDDFLIEADIESDYGNYTVRINKSGFIDDHPKEIKALLVRLCYFARFDQELHQFQLVREKWSTFKELFESVTGYEIKETSDIFSGSDDPMQRDMMRKYVLSFTIKKPHEIISHRECSNGERKVIKSFSTMLNLEISPKVILIDDIAMHVAIDKHMILIDNLRKCYPNSQIFSTTHSYRMTKNLKRREQIYDLRMLHANKIIKEEPWRLLVLDEIEDSLHKLKGLNTNHDISLYNTGQKLKDACHYTINDLQIFRQNLSKFLKEVSDLYVIGMMS